MKQKYTKIDSVAQYNRGNQDKSIKTITQNMIDKYLRIQRVSDIKKSNEGINLNWLLYKKF